LEGELALLNSDFATWAKKLEEACSLAEKLIALTPNDPMAYSNHSQLLDRLAMAYRSVDDHANMVKAYERSIEIQRRALKRWPYIPELRLKMADRSVGRFGILLHLNLYSDARDCIEEAIKMLRSKPFSPTFEANAESAISNLTQLASFLPKSGG
jgi:tetratricopeptide (TPR) repeat protein